VSSQRGEWSLYLDDIHGGQADVSPHLNHLHRAWLDSMGKAVIVLPVYYDLYKGKWVTIIFLRYSFYKITYILNFCLFIYFETGCIYRL
jgi:hypothetical protein